MFVSLLSYGWAFVKKQSEMVAFCFTNLLTTTYTSSRLYSTAPNPVLIILKFFKYYATIISNVDQ